MIAVITGDIINSREGEIEDWINPLKTVLDQYGEEPNDWEIFRGDSFQLKLKPELSLWAALHIRTAIKQSAFHDVRMAIGIGEQGYNLGKITESNGTAFINSGEEFESLKKRTLGVKTNSVAFNETINLVFDLSLLTIDSWTSVVARIIKTAIENPSLKQKDLAKLINKSQSSVSEALKRGGFDEIVKMNKFFMKKINEL